MRLEIPQMLPHRQFCAGQGILDEYTAQSQLVVGLDFHLMPQEFPGLVISENGEALQQQGGQDDNAKPGTCPVAELAEKSFQSSHSQQ